jgi:O-antigen/teichoic acid export membrane protein
MSVGANLAASALGNAWIAFVQVAFVPMYIDLLGVEAYGLIGVYAFLQMSLWILDMGFTPALNRAVAQASAGAGGVDGVRTLLRSMEWAFAGAGSILVVAAIAGAPWLAANWLRLDALPHASAEFALGLTGVLLAARLFIGLYRGAIAGAQRLVWLSAAGSAFATLRGAGVVAVLWLVPTIEAFFAFQLAVTVIEAGVMAGRAWRLLPSSTPASFSMAALRTIRRFSGGVTLIAFLLLALTQSDKLLLSTLLPLADFGHYALAGSVAGLLGLLAAPVSSVAFPRLTELAARGELASFDDAFHRFAQLVSIAVAPAAMVLGLFAADALQLWTGDVALGHAASPLLTLLSAGALLFALTAMPYLLPMVRGTPSRSCRRSGSPFRPTGRWPRRGRGSR